MVDGLQIVPYEDAITAKIKLIMPNTLVEEDGILDDQNLIRTPNTNDGIGGVLVPYIVPRYGSIRRRPLGFAIAGTRYDEYYSTVDISCVAPKGRMARQMLDVAVDALLGFKPDGVQEMTVEGLPDNFTIMNDQGRPAAFVSSVRLRFGVNGANVGAHMVPPAP
jgi:hypothetical protein